MLFDTLEFHGNKELDKVNLRNFLELSYQFQFFAHLLYMMNNIEKLANQYLHNTSVSEPPTLIQSIATTTVKVNIKFSFIYRKIQRNFQKII